MLTPRHFYCLRKPFLGGVSRDNKNTPSLATPTGTNCVAGVGGMETTLIRPGYRLGEPTRAGRTCLYTHYAHVSFFGRSAESSPAWPSRESITVVRWTSPHLLDWDWQYIVSLSHISVPVYPFPKELRMKFVTFFGKFLLNQRKQNSGMGGESWWS